MLRRAVTVSLLAVVAVLVSASTRGMGATSGSTTVVSRTGIPAPLSYSDSISGTNCGAPVAGTDRHVVGPGSPPLGVGSLQLGIDVGGTATISTPLGDGAAGSLTALSFSTYEAELTGIAFVEIEPQGGGHIIQYQDYIGLDGAGWMTTDVLTDSQAQWVDTTTDEVLGSGTFTQLLSTRPNYVVHDFVLQISNCLSTAADTTTNLDDLHIADAQGDTTYDFEAPLLDESLASRVSTTSTISGQPVTPAATLTSSGAPIAGKTVSLWAASVGQPYSKVETIATTARGTATASTQHPTVTTNYQWRSASDETYAAATSPTVTVRVASRVTLALTKSTIAKNKPVEASGTATPARPGQKVTLWRVKGHGKAKLTTTKARHNGTFTMSANLPAGHYIVFATVAADKSNTVGTSPRRKLNVK